MSQNDLWSQFDRKRKEFSVEEETLKVRAEFDSLPHSFKPQYKTRLRNALSQTNGPNFIKHSLAVWFEMSRLVDLSKQGTETLSPQAFHVDNPEKIIFQAYALPGKIRKSKIISIENDIPVTRNGNPFVYEVKYLPARPYGTINFIESSGKFAARDHDQLLKYQEALGKGLIEGATVEVQGRIDPQFLRWIYGEAINKPSPIPDVQLIYNMPLPSGQEYRTTIKRTGTAGRQLHFFNNDNAYTAEDREVIAGLEWALRHPDKRYIVNIIGDVHVKNPSPALAPYLTDSSGLTPFDIEDTELYREYTSKRMQGIWSAAQSVKPPLYNLINQDTPLADTYADPVGSKVALRNRIEQWQLFLQSNPDIAKIKKSYILGVLGTPEYTKKLDEVVENLSGKVQAIRDYEAARQSPANPDFHRSAAIRNAAGWEGPVEGYGLDLAYHDGFHYAGQCRSRAKGTFL